MMLFTRNLGSFSLFIIHGNLSSKVELFVYLSEELFMISYLSQFHIETTYTKHSVDWSGNK